jgi:hypothetical protein
MQTIEELASDLVLIDRGPGVSVLVRRKTDHELILMPLTYGSRGKRFLKHKDFDFVCRVGVGWKIEAGCCCGECLQHTKDSLIDRISSGLGRLALQEGAENHVQS